jgi:hypothetical protein
MEKADEDMISNTLVWILAKIMTFLAASENTDHGPAPPEDKTTQLSSNDQGPPLARSTDRYVEWHKLRGCVKDWFEKLPYTFRPCVRVPRPRREGGASPSRTSLFSEIYFSIPMCAASIQHYHFACILLLLNQPSESRQGQSIGERLQRYRQISDEVDHHAREVCGIGLANPPGAVRIHMLQPSYLAGLCLGHHEERQSILDLLRGIEAELGWVTGYRVDQLQAEWNWRDG